MSTLIRRSTTMSPPARGLAEAAILSPISARPIAKRSVTTQKLRLVAARNRGAGSPIATSASAALAPGARSPVSETAKVYAVIADAMHGKLTPARARAMATVLDALRDGRLVVQTADLSGSHAQYNHETNTLLCPREGFAVDSTAARATIIHEAQHAIQDANHAVQDRYASEFEGHEAAADYLLHSAGALIETPRGTRVDAQRAQELIGKQSEQSDAVAARALVGRIVRENIANGATDLNGHALGESAEEQLSAIASLFPSEDFSEVYARAVSTTGNQRNVEALSYVMHKAGL